MKKLLCLGAMLTALTLGANAQEKKAWLFYEGLSEETIANLVADKANWADNGKDADENVINWKNVVKQSADSYWMANGQVIEELRGLKIDIGSNKDNSVHLATVSGNNAGRIRLTRKSTKITFPKLANGQTVTVQGRSANGTATNRGIAPVQSYLKFQAEESSPQYNGACIFLGNQVEGSEGTYTFKWKVETEETDSVDVQFNLTPDAGIDFTYFMIDNGDAPDVEEAQPVGYLYSGSLDDDYAYAYLSGSEKFQLTEIDVTNTTADTDSLRKFNGIVISPTIGAESAYLPVIKQTVAYVPVLNLNPNIYEALGYGKATVSESETLDVVDTASAVFEGFDTEQPVELLQGANIVGVELGDYFAADKILAYAGSRENQIPAIHVHNDRRNAYILVPLPLDQMPLANQDNISTLIPQALLSVVETKRDITAVGTPVISPRQENGYTVVSITAQNSKAIYYTTDGSDPTTAGTLYTEPFTLTAPTTVKAFATGDGYSDSNIGSKDIVIMVQAAEPTINVTREPGKSTVTLSSPDNVDVYFNFTGKYLTKADAQLYTEPIELTDEPSDIYAFAIGGDFLQSEIAKKYIGIDGIDANTIRTDTVAHFSATWAVWNINTSEENEWGVTWSNSGSANYLLGKSAWKYYSEEVDHEEQGTDEEGNPTTITVYKPNPDAVRELTNEADPTWKLKSQGQVMTLENIGVAHGVGGYTEGDTNGRGNRYAEWAIDDLGGEPTTGAITFGGKTSGEPFTARIESTVKFQGPFDVVVYAGNGNSAPIASKPVHEVQVSTDGETWTAIGNLNFANTRRYYKKTRLHYEGTDEVYVRNAQISGGSSGQVYDIYILNNGEVSKQYSEETAAGITEQTAGDQLVRTEVFSLGGSRVNGSARGIQIVRKTYANGVVTTQKVVR